MQLSEAVQTTLDPAPAAAPGAYGENLIFLISQPRAGSTLLQRLLAGHSQVHTIAEPWIMLNPLYALRRSGHTAEYDASLARDTLEDLFQAAPEGDELYFEAVRSFAGTIYTRLLALSGKPIFLDKTPRYYYIIPELRRAFPQARFIFLLRNPLAVLASTLSTWFHDDPQALAKASHHADLYAAPGLILAGIEALGEDAVVVHYEDLTAQPEAMVREVCRQVGLEFEPAMLEYGAQPAPAGKFGDPVNIHRHRGAVTDYLDHWQDKLGGSAELLETAWGYLTHLGEDTLARMGYSYGELSAALDAAGRRLHGPVSPLVNWPADVLAQVEQADALIQSAAGLPPGENRPALEAALELLSQALAALPQDPWLLTMRGNLFLQLDELESARREYVKVVTFSPEYAQGYVNLAAVQVHQGALQAGRATLGRALALQPENAEAQVLQGFLDEIEGPAAAFFQQLLSSDDLLAALAANRERVTPALIHLVKLNMQAALADGQAGLAEALGVLLQLLAAPPPVAAAPPPPSSAAPPPPSSAAPPPPANGDLRQRELDALQRNWERFAETDPMWAILTAADKKGNRWKPGEFFETGIQNIEAVLQQVQGLGVRLRKGRALDFGCGLGRLTQALAMQFAEVHGLDIAPSMIEGARHHNRFSRTCHYHVNDRNDLSRFADGTFDLIYTIITLQHIKPELSRNYLKEFLRVLAPGGLLIFQLPSRNRHHQPGRPPALHSEQDVQGFNPDAPVMEMHAIVRDEVVALLERGGGRVLRIEDDPSLGADWESFKYFVVKQ